MRIISRTAVFLCFAIAFLLPSVMSAQTASSLYRISDGKQIDAYSSDSPDACDSLGHSGPAIENSHFALRLLFDESGAIDVYSKTGRGSELLAYKWYPNQDQIETAGAGCDNYEVGSTLGLGGVALWDGKKVLPLKVTKGREAKAGDTKNGSFIEMIAKGVPYMDGLVDISIYIETSRKSREAIITVKELSKKKIQVVTGVNYHAGMTVKCGNGYIFTWGVHPICNSLMQFPVGAGLFYGSSDFGPMEVTPEMVRVVSKPSSEISYKVVAASTREAELNNLKRFEAYMTK